MSEDVFEVSIVNDLVAGSLGGTIGIIVGHPLDTIKTRMQNCSGKTNVFKSFKGVLQVSGMSGFYRGMLAPISSYAVVNAVFFGSYGMAYRRLSENSIFQSEYALFAAAAAFGGFTQTFLSCPVEVVKCRLQAHQATSSNHYHKGPADAFKEIYRTQGYRGLYAGYTLHNMRDVFGFVTYMLPYEYLKENFNFDRRWKNLILAGGLAGVFSWVSVLPIDVVKTRVQADGLRFTLAGLARYCVELKRQHGFSFFFRGIGVMSLRAFIVNAVTLPVYTLTLEYMSEWEHQRFIEKQRKKKSN